MAVKALIFDMDGTLADTMPAHYVAWRETMARYGIEFSEDRFYALGGVPTKSIVSLLAHEAGLTLDSHAVAIEKEEEFLRVIDTIGPVPPVVEIAAMHRGKLPMAIATGAMRLILDRVLRQLEITDWFQATVTAEETERHKPEPDVFLEAARRLDVSPAHCRVYEDTDPGIEAARRAGMQVVDIRTLFQPRRVTPR